jgi:hypothetical protein
MYFEKVEKCPECGESTLKFDVRTNHVLCKACSTTLTPSYVAQEYIKRNGEGLKQTHCPCCLERVEENHSIDYDALVYDLSGNCFCFSCGTHGRYNICIDCESLFDGEPPYCNSCKEVHLVKQ